MEYIGTYISERLELLKITKKELSNKTLIDENLLNDIIENKKKIDREEFDLYLISNVLHCKPLYFYEKEVRKNDFLKNIIDKDDTVDTIRVKIKIYKMMNDSNFVDEIYKEISF